MEKEAHNMSDHDLLITMHEQIKNIRIDIADLKTGTSDKLADHEIRIRDIEKFKENWTGKNAIIAVVLMFIIGLLGNFFSKLL